MGAVSHLWVEPEGALPEQPRHGQHVVLRTGGYFLYDAKAGRWIDLLNGGKALDLRPWHRRVAARCLWLFGFGDA